MLVNELKHRQAMVMRPSAWTDAELYKLNSLALSRPSVFC
jgi:hypothetical protein